MTRRLGFAILALGLVHGTVEPGTSSRAALARGAFLVATHDLTDPNFARTVVLLLSYGEGGAMGVIINRRTDLDLSELFPDLEIPSKSRPPVYLGGPVASDGLLVLVQTEDDLEDSVRIFDDVWASDSAELLERLAKKPKKSRFRIFAGYAGWAPIQLDAEVARGDWIVVPGDAEIVFDDNPSRVWRSLAPRKENPLVTERLAPGYREADRGSRLWYD